MLPICAAQTSDETATELDHVSVVGRGERRQVQRVDGADTRSQVPGASPLKLLENRPGVSLQSADPFASYEWSTRITIRGFPQQKLAFSLDGIPLGDMSYPNHNGLHLSRALISENLRALELAQGSAALDAPATHVLGGAVHAYTRDPAEQFGGRADLSVGSQGSNRSYLRLDSGTWSDFSLLLSGLRQDGEKWKGQGDQRQTQFNGKARWRWAETEWRAFLASSQRRENDYMDMSLDSQRRLGWNWDYYAPDWQRAIDAAEGRFSGGVETLDDAYYRGRGLRNDELGYLAIDWLSGDWNFEAKLYAHRGRGQGHWITPYTPSLDVPLSLRTTDLHIDRSGFLPRLDWAGEQHQFAIGGWWEDNEHRIQRDFYGLERSVPPDQMRFFRNPDVQVFAQDFDIDTRQFWLRDHWRLLDQRLDLEWGFKATDVRIRARSPLGDRAAGELRSRDYFQPQFGLRFSVSDEQELFAAYQQSTASFNAGFTGPFAASQAAFDQFAGALRAEQAHNMEFGWRVRQALWEASVAAYQVNFQDRLLAISQCTGILGCPVGFANVGDVRTRGVELAFDWRPSAGWHAYISASYNDSQYLDDYLDGDTLVPTAGKQVVDTPRWLLAGRLQWQQGPWSAGLSSKYTDQRFYTYSNDAKVAAHTITDIDLSWRPELGQRLQLELRLKLGNVFNERYFATVDSNGFVAFDPQGQHYSLLVGAPRQWFFTAELGF
ncbi:TonB-dependent receptor [Pseudomarimonas arenosa]|uniref:TonB-dependent receptor n=1 Tax=Pseudomarimonas arenosa TaxID=2774145 RepID=A0AAW3ZGW3_9GAMM|nr:TonB-dependent receptor [Pseudomarimonas arenosa]MBD8525068.1 TonB-dependent receptor [Pseudomarimonas arenosa]